MNPPNPSINKAQPERYNFQFLGINQGWLASNIANETRERLVSMNDLLTTVFAKLENHPREDAKTLIELVLVIFSNLNITGKYRKPPGPDISKYITDEWGRVFVDLTYDKLTWKLRDGVPHYFQVLKLTAEIANPDALMIPTAMFMTPSPISNTPLGMIQIRDDDIPIVIQTPSGTRVEITPQELLISKTRKSVDELTQELTACFAPYIQSYQK